MECLDRVKSPRDGPERFRSQLSTHPMPSGEITAHSGEGFPVLLPQNARDRSKQCVNFTARQQWLELNYSFSESAAA
jgi:hypothetical protein